jgi:hypothetical protein
VVGRTVGRVLGIGVAEATVKDFLDRVGQAITSHARADGGEQVGGQGGTSRDAAP